MTIKELFDKHENEHLKFNRIPREQRLHNRPDICGMLYLDKLSPDTRDMVSGADHDVIYFDVELDADSASIEDDVIYLLRCGVIYDTANESLYSFV